MEIDIEKLTCGIQLTDIERNVLEYLLTHLDQALKLGVRGVARENFTSTSTVMRLSRKLGYNGFIEMYYRNLLGGLYRENPVKSRNYEAVKSSKKWENVGNSYIIPALLLYRYSYI